MNILINNTLNMGRGTVYHLKKGISGLEKAPIRTSGSEYAGRDGGFISGQFYGRRTIPLQGRILSSTVAQHQIDRKALEAAFPIKSLIDVLITMPDNAQYYLQAKVTKFDMDITHSNASDYKVEITTEDALIYGGGSAPNYGLQTVTVDKLDTGGFILPVILPIVTTAEGYTTAVNNGDIEIAPVIYCVGQYTNPKIYNMRTNSVIGVNVATAAGDTLIIDMKNRQITLNGVSVLFYKSPTGDFWTLKPGNNDLYLETSSGSDQASVDVKFRDAYSGL
jgi:hypothetical protein